MRPDIVPGNTIMLRPGLAVHKIDNGYYFRGRPSFVDLWQDLRDMSRESRPDWDLAERSVEA